MIKTVSGWPAALLLLIVSGTAEADDLKLAETPLAAKRCKVVEVTRTDDAGRPLRQRDWFASVWRCTGYRGRPVMIAYGDQREGLAFDRGRRPSYVWPARFGSWGPTLEWRGQRAIANGRAPLFGIARYSWNIGPPGGAPPRDRGAELAVIRIGSTSKDTCILAWVDTSANADALTIARMFADGEAARLFCDPAAQPQQLGKQRPPP